MKKILVLLFGLCVSITAFGQYDSWGDVPEKAQQEFIQKMKQNSPQTLTSDFYFFRCDTREMFEKVRYNKSEGKLYYQTPCLLRWETTTSRFITVDKSTQLYFNSNTFKILLSVIDASIYQDEKNFEVSIQYWPSMNEWRVQLTPKRKSYAKEIELIEIYFTQDLLNIESITLHEYRYHTDINFENQINNQPLDNKLFYVE